MERTALRKLQSVFLQIITLAEDLKCLDRDPVAFLGDVLPLSAGAHFVDDFAAEPQETKDALRRRFRQQQWEQSENDPGEEAEEEARLGEEYSEAECLEVFKLYVRQRVILDVGYSLLTAKVLCEYVIASHPRPSPSKQPSALRRQRSTASHHHQQQSSAPAISGDEHDPTPSNEDMLPSQRSRNKQLRMKMALRRSASHSSILSSGNAEGSGPSPQRYTPAPPSPTSPQQSSVTLSPRKPLV